MPTQPMLNPLVPTMLLTAKRSLIDWIALGIVHVFPRMLGLLFLYTSYQKIMSPDGLKTVLAYDHLPAMLIDPIAWMVIGLELALGAALLLFIWCRRGLLAISIGLLLLYVVQIGYLLLFSDAPTCSCIEGVIEFEHARKSNALSLARNVCLILPALWTRMQLTPLPSPPYTGERAG
jgi:hypothetical protein